MTIIQAIAYASLIGLDRLDSQLLLLHLLGKAPTERAWLLSHDGDAVSAAQAMAFERAVAQRKNGVPLEYITGHAAFYGLDLLVDQRVLIPRPDTETLVDWALAVIDGDVLNLGADSGSGDVLDLGTGSGAVALALKQARPHLRVCATDASLDALVVAQANAGRLNLAVNFIHGDWLGALRNVALNPASNIASNIAPNMARAAASSRFKLIVSNPPYIAAADPHLPALAHEPVQALTSGEDGLFDIRQIVAQAPAHLQAGGWLLLEHGYDQAERVRALLKHAGFTAVASRRDLAGHERCSGARFSP
jgi:release factor glutamine methyltransferase